MLDFLIVRVADSRENSKAIYGRSGINHRKWTSCAIFEEIAGDEKPICTSSGGWQRRYSGGRCHRSAEECATGPARIHLHCSGCERNSGVELISDNQSEKIVLIFSVFSDLNLWVMSHDRSSDMLRACFWCLYSGCFHLYLNLWKAVHIVITVFRVAVDFLYGYPSHLVKKNSFWLSFFLLFWTWRIKYCDEDKDVKTKKTLQGPRIRFLKNINAVRSYPGLVELRKHTKFYVCPMLANPV